MLAIVSRKDGRWGASPIRGGETEDAARKRVAAEGREIHGIGLLLGSQLLTLEPDPASPLPRS